MNNATQLIRPALVALFVVMVLLNVLADSQNATLTLSGTVAPKASVSISPQNNYNSLDLMNGEMEKVVAIVNERSNDKAGYTVALTSIGAEATSQAQLRPITPGNPNTIAYSLKYGGAPVVLNHGSAILTTASGRTANMGSNCLLTVTIHPSAEVTADSYADTLRLTVQGN